jgi:hypothetical protein
MIARKVCPSSQDNFGPQNARTESRMACISGKLVKGTHRG